MIELRGLFCVLIIDAGAQAEFLGRAARSATTKQAVMRENIITNVK